MSEPTEAEWLEGNDPMTERERMESAMATDNRTNEPSDAQRQKAAAELRIRYGAGSGSHPWIEFQGNPRLIVDQVLAATGATQVLPSSGVDEYALANLIHSTSVANFGGLDPRVAPIIARAVAEFLKGEER